MPVLSLGSYRMIFIAIICLMSAGCSRYYIPEDRPSSTASEVSNAVSEGKQREKYFILRHSSGNYEMKNIRVDQDKQLLSFDVNVLPDVHKHYIQFDKGYRYKKSDSSNQVLNEVHFYVKGKELKDEDGKVSLPVDSIQKIEVIEFDKGRTNTSYVLGGVGIGLGAIAVTTVIILLTKSSCPFVAVHNGEDFDIQGELFGGAIYPSLEREDHILLRAKPINGEYILRISNELQEKQFTNFADLLVITHPEDVRVAADPLGKIHTIGKAEPPARAMLNGKSNMVTQLSEADNVNCLFDDSTAADKLNELVLTFDRQKQLQGKLVLQLKNSYWFDYLYGEFTRAFGSYYNRWHKRQKKIPATNLEMWSKSQHIPMQVSIKTSKGWELITDLKTIGPLASRELVIPLDLQNVKTDKVEIKLTTGFLFWELDYAGLDLSESKPFFMQTLKPYYAEDEKGKNVLPELMQSDKKHLYQPVPGMAAIIKYKTDSVIAEGYTRSVILHTKGWYEHVRNYSGKPRFSFLKTFKQPNAFSRFSWQQLQMNREKQRDFTLN